MNFCKYVDDDILRLISIKEMTTGEIAKELGENLARISSRMASLRKYKLVERVKAGFAPKYKLRKDYILH